MSEKLKRGAFYPAEGKKPWIMAKWTGEKRPPREGEWYLSGAIIQAWQARANMTTPYHIAKLYEVERITIVREKKHDQI